MTSISRAFGGRCGDDVDPSRIPPGRCYERGLPVLSAGPTPRTPGGGVGVLHPAHRRRGALMAMGRAHGAADGRRDGRLHCVTEWSKLGTRWTGVSVDTLLDGVETEADWVTRVRRRRLHD
jgi:hypothetical protein